MATSLLTLQIIVLAYIFYSASTSTNVTVNAYIIPSPLPTQLPPPPSHEHAYPTSLLGPILTSLGFHGFSAAAPSLSNVTTWRGPTTIFAPADSSLFTCPSCSIPLLLHEHSVPGLFPLNYMRTLPFGTKIETLATGRCITITFSNTTSESDVFVSGVQITRPDLYNDGLVAVHGLQGFVSHLSPYSCDINRMTSLSFFPHHPPSATTTPFFLMHLMLKDAMLRLSTSGYGVVALALRIKLPELVNLQSMTVFALNDESIFSANGYAYVTHFRFHVVPNKLLMAADLESLVRGAVLPTVEPGQKLVVTNVAPIRINSVDIKSLDLVYNLKIVVHGLFLPFPRFHQGAEVKGRSGFILQEYKYDVPPQPPVIKSTAEIDDNHGL